MDDSQVLQTLIEIKHILLQIGSLTMFLVCFEIGKLLGKLFILMAGRK